MEDDERRAGVSLAAYMKCRREGDTRLRMLTLLAAVLAAMLVLTVFAADEGGSDAAVGDEFQVGDLFYKITVVPGGGNGKVDLINDNSYNALTTVTVPAEVTKIDEGKKYDVTGIADIAFSGTSLKNLNLSGATALKIVGNGSFGGCTSLAGTVDIPASVEAIGDYAFCECISLQTLNLSGATALKTVGNRAFHMCTNLTGEVTIPASVDVIESSPFGGCAAAGFALKVAAGNGKFTMVDGMLFDKDVKRLINGVNSATVTIPASVTKIVDFAFRGYTALQTLNLSEATALKTIGEYAFYGCTYLQNLNLSEATALKTIGEYAFSDCAIAGTVGIPASVESIGSSSFSGCASLKTLNLSGATALKTIGEYAFYKCTSLQSLNLSGAAALTSIGEYAFCECTAIAEAVDIPASVELIGSASFSGCIAAGFALKVAAGNSKFTTVDGMLFDKDVKMLINGVNSATVTIPASVTEIGSFAFYGCTSLQTLNLSEATALKTIGYRAFHMCTGLTGEVTIPASVESIIRAPFSGCTAAGFELKVAAGNSKFTMVDGMLFDKDVKRLINGVNSATVTIPASVTEIGSFAFYGCTALKTLNLSEATALKTIGSRAFNLCTNLTGEVIIPSSVESIPMAPFSGCTAAGFELKVAAGNGKFTMVDGMLFDKDVKRLINGMNSATVIIPASVTEIVDFAFHGNYSVKTITFKGVLPATINGRAFSLGTAEHPAKVTVISDFDARSLDTAEIRGDFTTMVFKKPSSSGDDEHTPQAATGDLLTTVVVCIIALGVITACVYVVWIRRHG